MKTAVAATATLLATGFGLLQLIPTPAGSNPPVKPGHSIEAHLPLPHEIRNVFDRACRDCHSNTTRWPWYGRIAPMSWLLARDVTKARQVMNLSDWPATAGRTPTLTAATLLAACAGVESGRMPLAGYRKLHPNSRLNPAEIRTFCGWARSESERIITGGRHSVIRAGQPDALEGRR